MKLKHLFVTLVSLVALSSCATTPAEQGNGLTYAPWTDISYHYDLSKVKVLEGGMRSFNSLDISYGKQIFSSDRINNNEYNATVLGTSVCLRSQPVVRNSSKRSLLNTGDKLTVMRPIGFMNGKYWDYVYVNTGYSMGLEGYVCSDYVVSQEQAEIIQGYVFQNGSNLNLATPSKILRAIADVLLKFDVNKRHLNLSVQMLSNINYGEHTIVTYQIRDLGIAENSTMLAVVQFFNSNNDFIVLGVVPGTGVNNVLRNANGSYDVYFY